MKLQAIRWQPFTTSTKGTWSGRLDHIRLPIVWHRANKLGSGTVFLGILTRIASGLPSSSIMYNGRGIDVSGTSLAWGESSLTPHLSAILTSVFIQGDPDGH